MISFRPLRENYGATSSKLQFEWHISPGVATSIMYDRPVNSTSIDKLCKVIGCKIEDVCEYVEDEKTK